MSPRFSRYKVLTPCKSLKDKACCVTLPFYGIINTRRTLQTNHKGNIHHKLPLSLIALTIGESTSQRSWLHITTEPRVRGQHPVIALCLVGDSHWKGNGHLAHLIASCSFVVAAQQPSLGVTTIIPAPLTPCSSSWGPGPPSPIV